MTLIQTAKLNGVDPQAWLIDVLERIVARQIEANELHRLLPWKLEGCHGSSGAQPGSLTPSSQINPHRRRYAYR